MLQFILVAAATLLVLIALRNVIAFPLGLVLQLFGVQDATASSRRIVGITGRIVFGSIFLLLFIKLVSLSWPAYSELFFAWGDFFKAFARLIYE